jgi:hypothetical protein
MARSGAQADSDCRLAGDPSDAIRRLKALEQRKARIDRALGGPADIHLAKLAGELEKTPKKLAGPQWPIAQISRSRALQSSRTQAQYLYRTAVCARLRRLRLVTGVFVSHDAGLAGHISAYERDCVMLQ